MASMIALWSFFGLFTGVAKLAIVAVTLAFVGWRAGWWNRLGLARRVLAWSRLPEAGRGRVTSGDLQAHPEGGSVRERFRRWLDWRKIALLILLAWVAAWVMVQRMMISAHERPPAAPVSSGSGSDGY